MIRAGERHFKMAALLDMCIFLFTEEEDDDVASLVEPPMSNRTVTLPQFFLILILFYSSCHEKFMVIETWHPKDCVKENLKQLGYQFLENGGPVRQLRGK